MQSPLATTFPWLVFAAGALLAGVYVLRVLRASLNVAALGDVLRKLLDAGDADRAIKLTLAAPRSPHCAAARAAIEACRAGAPQPDPSSNYRDAGDPSPERLLAPVRARYDEAYAEAARPLRSARPMGAVGALMLVASAFIARAHAAPLWLGAASTLGLVVLAWSSSADQRLERGRHEMFERLRGSFDALIRDPRRGHLTAAR